MLPSMPLARVFIPLLHVFPLVVVCSSSIPSSVSKNGPRYATNTARVQNRESLIQKLQDAFLTKTYEEWEQLLLA